MSARESVRESSLACFGSAEKQLQFRCIECAVAIRVEEIKRTLESWPSFVWDDLAIAVSIDTFEEQFSSLAFAARNINAPPRSVRGVTRQEQAEKGVVVESIVAGISLPKGNQLKRGDDIHAALSRAEGGK